MPVGSAKVRERYGDMEPPDILDAARSMNKAAVVAAVEADRECVRKVDPYSGQNAIHILVNAGFFRTEEIIRYLLQETTISLHTKDSWGRDPIDLAEELNDVEALTVLRPRWQEESEHIRNAQGDEPDLSQEFDPAPR